MVRGEGRPGVKVLDFGIARRLEDRSEQQSFYTPRYASPEQKAGLPPTVASEIYSLGLLCATLLDRWLRGDLKAVVEKATQVLPDDRYATMEAFRDDLNRVRLVCLLLFARSAMWSWPCGGQKDTRWRRC